MVRQPHVVSSWRPGMGELKHTKHTICKKNPFHSYFRSMTSEAGGGGGGGGGYGSRGRHPEKEEVEEG